MNLFARSREAKPVENVEAKTREAVMTLRATLEHTEKRMRHVEKQGEQMKRNAIEKSRRKDKQGALFCLKRKRLLDKQVETLSGAQVPSYFDST